MSARHARPVEVGLCHVEQLDDAGQPVAYIGCRADPSEAHRFADAEAYARDIPRHLIVVTIGAPS